jgi:frataxin-like iron-binding protein CyaY
MYIGSYMASNGKMIMNYELGKPWKGSVSFILTISLSKRSRSLIDSNSCASVIWLMHPGEGRHPHFYDSIQWGFTISMTVNMTMTE